MFVMNENARVWVLNLKSWADVEIEKGHITARWMNWVNGSMIYNISINSLESSFWLKETFDEHVSFHTKSSSTSVSHDHNCRWELHRAMSTTNIKQEHYGLECS